MKEFFKKQTIGSYLLLGSFVLGLIGFILYLVCETTGYNAGKGVDGWQIFFYIAVLVGTALLFVFHDKTAKYNVYIGLLLSALWILAICFLSYERRTIVADIYFIPVNHAESEDVAMAQTWTNLVFDLLAFIALDVSLFFGLEPKEEAKPAETSQA